MDQEPGFPPGYRSLAILPVWNPNGIPSRSPGLDREAGLPWVNDLQSINPNGVTSRWPGLRRTGLPWVRTASRRAAQCGEVESLRLKGRNPIGVVGHSAIPPRVARSSQPWALGRNPFGIGKCPRARYVDRSGLRLGLSHASPPEDGRPETAKLQEPGFPPSKPPRRSARAWEPSGGGRDSRD